MNTDNGFALAPANREGIVGAYKMPSAAAMLLEKSQGLQSTTLNPDDPASLVTLVQMETAEQLSLWDNTPEFLNVVHISVKEQEIFVKETGEVVQAPRTVFLSADGTVWGTNSGPTAATALKLLRILEFRGEIDPPITLRFIKKRLGPKRVTLLCIPDEKSLHAVLAVASKRE